jgi:two-component system catabolic regulation response regulator CreB
MKPNILVVEDESAIADTIVYALETDGFTVTSETLGYPAAGLLAEQEIDLIILDIGLPDINGIELCKMIRRDYTTPIIFLTARADEIDRVVGLEIGGDDYVVKPFSPRELCARVKAVLRRARGSGREDPAACQVFAIDEKRMLIRYYNQPLSLSRYEYEILKTFIRQPGRVYSRQQLMDRVWSEPDVSMDRTIDAHIKNIRAKLRAVVPDVDPIVTHRGSGYALKEDV